MKHLLNGVAIAAALALAVPAWAATSAAATSPSSTGASAASTDTTSATAPKHRRARHVMHRTHHKMAMHRGMPRAAGDMANELNRQELSRIQSGGSSAPAPAPAPQGPKASGSNYIPPSR